MKNLISLFAVAVSSSLFALACSSAPEDATSTDEASKVNVYACQVDDDCTAVPQAGCCPHGYYAAVNKHHIKAYENQNACQNPHQICPLYVVHETRVAQCNTGTNKCEMIQPTDIRCGGFTRNPHTCPDGYACNFSGHVPDVPGTCKEVTCPAYQHVSGSACVDNPHCGGLTTRHCPSTYSACQDDPRDSCDPQHGGADCGGVCVK